jgi:acyl-CoA synthetase (AMP-forming)/AMP-acid ligase II
VAIVDSGLGVARRVGFVAGLERHGDAPAVVDVDGTVCSYRELARRADDVSKRLGPERRLVLVEGTNDLDGIVAYLGALRGGHAVLLVGPDDEHSQALVRAYDPDVVVGAGLSMVERRQAAAHELHPDLALLLSTSGSTGSPKLVRLSHHNLEANAASIVEYLGLRSHDRAITSLPLQYCYGLSVLHSHLAVGAGVVCTPASVVDPCFWEAVDRHGVTNLAGVPHTFELLDRTDFGQRRHPSLRLLTQAGGHLDPGAVQRWHELGQQRGFDLFVMYGQTEATARMAYLPPSLVEHRPAAVGVAVPGGSFRLAPVEGAGADEGELVYDGPNVMLGYAEAPEDLALGRTVTELRTGDLARIDTDGVVEIVGRLRQFVKVFGLRLDLRRLAVVLAEHGVRAECLGDDTGLAVAVLDDTDPGRVRSLLAEHTGLPGTVIAVDTVTEVPRLANGKLDAATLTAHVRARAGQTDAPTGEATVAALLGGLLGKRPGPDDTFVSLGGDSLTYVEASILLEERLGHLPSDWHLRPVGELDDVDPRTTGRRPRLARLETGVLLRAVAIVLVVGNHAGAFLVGGGAHVLFAASGFNMARFQLSSGSWGRSLARIVVPSVLWIGGVAAVREDFDLAHALLLHGWVGGPGRWAYWFVEVLAQVLVVVAIALRVPVVARFEQRRPFAFPALLLVPALAVRFDVIELGEHHRPFFRPHEIAWIFLLGWMAARARSPWQRAVVSAAAVAAVPGFFDNGLRETVLLVGFLVLVWIPSVPVPRGVPRLVAPLASASLYVYLTHVQVHPPLSARSPVLGLLASLAVGIAAWRAAQPVQRRIESALAGRRTTSSAAGSPGASPLRRLARPAALR